MNPAAPQRVDASVGEHWIRPGVTLHWSADLPASPAGADSTPADALIDFMLGAERSGDRMRLLRADADRYSCATEPALFHVMIALTTAALHELLAGDLTAGAARLREFATGDLAAPVSLPLTPHARLAVESIRRCPFAGACRSMALTARCNDLLVEFLHAFSSASPPTPPPTASVIAQIHTAAELLRRKLEVPPSLAALSREVGLSETTLKRGFHRVFNTTVFGYLRTCRMERAHALLLSGEATVLEAAALVGYSNPSNFSAAFRRHFGINPKEFQLTARR